MKGLSMSSRNIGFPIFGRARDSGQGWFSGLALVATLAGCPSAQPQPQPDPAPASPEPAAPDVVLTESGPVAPSLPCAGMDGFAWLDSSWLDGSALELCSGSEPLVCVALDTKSGTWMRRPTPTDAEREARNATRTDVEWLEAETIAAAQQVHSLCTSDKATCHDVKFGKGRVVMRSFSADGALAVYTLHVGTVEMDFPDKMEFHVFERQTGKLLKKHTYQDRDGNYRCGGARFVDRWLLVGVDVCAGPGGEAWFLDPRTGRKVADIAGKESFGNYEPQAVVIDDTIAILEQNGTRFAVHDRKTGKFLKIVDLLPNEQLETEPYGNNLWQRADGDLLIALNGPATGTVLHVDGKTLALKARHQLARCPTP